MRGVETTRYRATIDVDEALADLDAGARERYEETMNQAGVEEIPVEIWLDEQNRVRRYAMDMKTDTPDDAPGPSQDTDMRMQMISDYYDFGTAVDVQAPPENQTMDYSKLVQSQQPAAAQ